jgi:hypothetical protein
MTLSESKVATFFAKLVGEQFIAGFHIVKLKF